MGSIGILKRGVSAIEGKPPIHAYRKHTQQNFIFDREWVPIEVLGQNQERFGVILGRHDKRILIFLLLPALIDKLPGTAELDVFGEELLGTQFLPTRYLDNNRGFQEDTPSRFKSSKRLVLVPVRDNQIRKLVDPNELDGLIDNHEKRIALGDVHPRWNESGTNGSIINFC